LKKKQTRKSAIPKKRYSAVKKPTTGQKKPVTIEEQILRLQTKEPVENIEKAPMTYLASMNSLDGKLAQIGKFKQEVEQTDEVTQTVYTNQPLRPKQYEFNPKK
jgi:hypothetical protein